MAEHLTAAALRARLDLQRTEFDRLQRAKVWPRARTKAGDRYTWPAALHAYIKERERVVRAELPDSVSGEQLGAIINRTTRTLHNYQKDGIPHETHGPAVRYPLAGAVQWYLARHSAEAGGEKISLAKQREEEELRTARNKRMTSDIDLAERLGKVVTIEFMLREFEETMAAIRDALRAMPGDLADKVLGLTTLVKARAVLRTGVDRAMAAIRDGLTKVAERAQNALGEHPELEEDADDADDAS